MRTKIIIIAIAILIFIAVIVSLMFSKNQKTISPVKEKGASVSERSPTIPAITLKEYKDEAGFKFNYPDLLTVSQQTNNDQNAYSDIKIQSDKMKGTMRLKVTEILPTTLENLIKTEKTGSLSSTVKDTKLADLKAKEITEDNKTKLIALDANILFTIEVDFQTNPAFWREAYNKIVSSFTFAKPQSTVPNSAESVPSNSGDQSGDVIDQGEEIVE